MIVLTLDESTLTRIDPLSVKDSYFSYVGNSLKLINAYSL